MCDKMLKRLNKKQGFTLVEILIVVGVITMLAALSLHGLLRARLVASEAAAIKSLRTVQAAMEAYRTINGEYPQDDDPYRRLTNANPPYLDSGWTPGQAPEMVIRQGYKIQIKMVRDNGQEYFLIAEPDTQSGFTGGRQFILAQMEGFSPEITDGEFVGLGSAGAPN
jgi:prepilin-type N-terminal cleavage/methylation domain-containing protein